MEVYASVPLDVSEQDLVARAAVADVGVDGDGAAGITADEIWQRRCRCGRVLRDLGVEARLAERVREGRTD